MTFGVSRDAGSFEWSGSSLSAIFAQKSNLLNLSHWRMIYDIIRFNQHALDLLRSVDDDSEVFSNGSQGSASSKTSSASPAQLSIGDYLEKEGYSDAFRDNYLIPMTAAVWSTSPDKCALEFPALTLIRFMWNHHLLTTIATRPDWMTIPSGSKSYIDAILKDFPSSNIHLDSEVIGLEEINGKLILQLEESEDLFDHVILACHGENALELVGPGGTDEEREILNAFDTSENIAVLHSDTSLMPRRRNAWSAWNLLFESGEDQNNEDDTICLTYNMNFLQHIPPEVFGDVLVTLNPIAEPDPDTVQGRWTYNHPLYTSEAVQAQKLLPRIQNTRGLSYCGAWTKYGFHEDGFSSGIKVAIDHLGAKLPFDFVDSTFSRGHKPQLGVVDFMARIFIWYIGWVIWWLEPYVSFLVRILKLLRIVPSGPSRRKAE
jgi:predicted NAD/FAD-binding protein